MVDNASTLSPLRRAVPETFAAQLALSRIHPNLVPFSEPVNGGALDPEASSWSRLPEGRGFESFGLARALRILLDVLSGLSALHDTQTGRGADFVHGGLAPDAVRIDPQGVARVLPLMPFHWQASGVAPSTQSLGHLAPERLLGDAVDRRADVFSAGVFLWEALAGRRLFAHDSVDGIITQLMGGKVLLPELPPELSWAAPLKAVAMRALAIDPEQRFADCSQLAFAIEGIAGGQLAEHRDVATFFGAPFFGATLRPRPAIESEHGSQTHQSSLSAMVTASVRPAPDEEPPPRSDERRTHRVAWIAGIVVTAFVALGLFAVARHEPVASPVSASPERASPERASPEATSQSSAPEVVRAPMPTTASADAGRQLALPLKAVSSRVPGRAVPSGARESKPLAVPKPNKPASPKPTRSAPTDAEQYGI